MHMQGDSNEGDSPRQVVEVVDIHDDPRFERYHKEYFSIMGRKGVTPGTARYQIKTNPTVLAAVMVRGGQ